MQPTEGRQTSTAVQPVVDLRRLDGDLNQMRRLQYFAADRAAQFEGCSHTAHRTVNHGRPPGLGFGRSPVSAVCGPRRDPSLTCAAS